MLSGGQPQPVDYLIIKRSLKISEFTSPIIIARITKKVTRNLNCLPTISNSMQIYTYLEPNYGTIDNYMTFFVTLEELEE